VREALTATTEKVLMEVTAPEVTVKQQFHIGPETDIHVFNLCPTDNIEVRVSCELRGGKEDAPVDCFDWSGKFLSQDDRKELAGTSTSQARGDGNGSLVRYKDGDLIDTLSKSQRKAPIVLSYSASQGNGDVEKVVVLSDDPPKNEVETLCTVAMPGPQRAFDVDASERYIAVLQDTPRNIHLYKSGQEQPVATYTPPSPRCRPSDVCFFKLGKKEVLLVADEGTDSIHVLRVQDGAVTFLRYLAPDVRYWCSQQRSTLTTQVSCGWLARAASSSP
jgi:hypothetical protein